MTKNLRKNIAFLVITILCISLFLGIIGYSLSKYIIVQHDNYAQKSSEFYFTSDFLTATQSNYNINNANSSFNITIKNYNNTANYCLQNIEFTLSVTGASVSGGNPNNDVYTLIGNQVSEIIITITPTSEIVNVSATSVSPYTATISSVFTIIPNEAAFYYISAVPQNSTILKLGIIISSVAPTITIQWDVNHYSFENTNPIFQNAQLVGNTATCELYGIRTNQTYEIDFFCLTNGTSDAVANTAINSPTITIVLPTPIAEE